MSFDELLDRIYFFDIEVFAHDNLIVFISNKTKERTYFHNGLPNDIQNFLDSINPILVAYNCKGYDKWILKCMLAGFTPEEIKEANDYIINGGEGWNLDAGKINLPPMWDLMDDIVPRKSLKEIEGHMCMDITETTVEFDRPNKWNKQEFEEVLYYCTADVKALIPLMEKRRDYYQAKYTICEMGNIDFEYGLGLTNANLTAVFLKAKRQEHDDKNNYQYPSNFELQKILPEAKEYFDSFIRGDIDIDEQNLPLTLDGMRGNVGAGGIHLALDNYIFESEDFNIGDYYE